MIDYDALEANVRNKWVLPASGLGQQSVYLANQDLKSRAPGPCIIITVGGAVKRGFDTVQNTYDGTKPNGQEIQRVVSGHRTLEVVLEAFSPDTVERSGAATARALLSKCQDALGLPQLRQNLRDVGLGVLNEGGPVVWQPAIHDAKWEGRARLEVTFCVVATAGEALGYIATVNMTGSVKQSQQDTAVTFPVKVELP